MSTVELACLLATLYRLSVVRGSHHADAARRDLALYGKKPGRTCSLRAYLSTVPFVSGRRRDTLPFGSHRFERGYPFSARSASASPFGAGREGRRSGSGVHDAPNSFKDPVVYRTCVGPDLLRSARIPSPIRRLRRRVKLMLHRHLRGDTSEHQMANAHRLITRLAMR